MYIVRLSQSIAPDALPEFAEAAAKALNTSPEKMQRLLAKPSKQLTKPIPKDKAEKMADLLNKAGVIVHLFEMPTEEDLETATEQVEPTALAEASTSEPEEQEEQREKPVSKMNPRLGWLVLAAAGAVAVVGLAWFVQRLNTSPNAPIDAVINSLPQASNVSVENPETTQVGLEAGSATVGDDVSEGPLAAEDGLAAFSSRAASETSNGEVVAEESSETDDLQVNIEPINVFKAARAGSGNEMAAAIAQGQDILVTDAAEQTLLMYAAGANADVEVIRQLIAAGLDVNAKNQSGWTALMFAIRDNPNHLVALELLVAGAEASTRNLEGKIAYDYFEDNPALVAIREKAVADVPLVEPNVDTSADAYSFTESVTERIGLSIKSCQDDAGNSVCYSAADLDFNEFRLLWDLSAEWPGQLIAKSGWAAFAEDRYQRDYSLQGQAYSVSYHPDNGIQISF